MMNMINESPGFLGVPGHILKRRAWQREWIKFGKGLSLNRRRAVMRYRAGRLTSKEKDLLTSLFGGLCAYCGKEPARVFDHIKAISNGGKTVPENMVPCCEKCNKSKRAAIIFVVICRCSPLSIGRVS